MNLRIPELSLIVLIGPSGSGKSTFARKHFKPTEVLSSDFCRALASDDENEQSASHDAFDVLHYIAGKRLARGLLTVIDAAHVQPDSRAPLLRLAREHDVLPVAIALNPPEQVCHDRNRARPDRNFGPRVIRQQCQMLRRTLRKLDSEGFRYSFILNSLEEIDAVTIERQPLWNNRKADRGPFDIIGDVHGCFDELCDLLAKLGYILMSPDGGGFAVTPPLGRKAIFLGDLVDRGPNTPAVMRLVMSMTQQGCALCIPGNHDAKLLRKLRGHDVQIAHGLAETLAQLENEPPEFRDEVMRFIDGLISHYVLDDGRLVVAHAGMKQQYIGRASSRVREFALYDDTTGETDELGLPVRNNWAADYRGPAAIVYGHTPVAESDWLNNTLNIDTGCVFGGKLTALRWPEREVVSVPAQKTYSESRRPFLAQPNADALSPQQSHDDVLDIADVTGKRVIQTRLIHSVMVRERQAAAALEVMSRFASSPKWLIYLPPTMSPTETSAHEDLLGHPAEAFAYFRNQGVGTVICQEKHMGLRAVVIICRDGAAARRRFGVSADGTGIIYTRTGRRFFTKPQTESDLLSALRQALDAAGFWDEFQSDWFCFDCELMPWSAKAQDLLRTQYAAVGSAARPALADSIDLLEQTARRGSVAEESALQDLLRQQRDRAIRAKKYVQAYRRYCWNVDSICDLKLAPFHLLASESKAHVDRDHLWHMEHCAKLAFAAPRSPLMATRHLAVDVTDATSMQAGIDWWSSLTNSGGEGMVVKPLQFSVRGPRGLAQPAVKCRGKEYLRIIYGPEYDAPHNLSRLRSRGVAAKRSLALREFVLGIEALERFVRREPLRRVHECVFGVLAMESEAVDPRL